MRLVRSLFVILAAAFMTAVAWEAQAQYIDPYVSCVRCHALPMTQARAEMMGHGYGYPPDYELACTGCHDTWWHEQDPNAPPPAPYFLFPAGGPGSFMKNACVRCHADHTAGTFIHADDVFPFLDGTPPSEPPLLAAPPTSVLPLFDFWGAPNQSPYAGGLVCSTCHDPHDPSYPVNGSSKFLRIGSWAAPDPTAPLCGYCHDMGTPPTTGDDLFIPSHSDSVRFELMPAGDLRIDVTVRNRGNAYPSSYTDVFWEDETGYRTYVGPLSVPSIPPEGEAVVPVYWMPPPGWDFGEGFFVFVFPPRPLVEGFYPVEFVRSMNVLPAPTNVRVVYATPGEIHLEWDPPFNPAAGLGWDVYRDGVKVTPAPIPYYPYGPPSFVDGGLAPETPHIYRVVAVSMDGGIPSAPSDPVGGTTAIGAVLRVPDDHPTIQAAIDAAGYGTSIHVAPGTYFEPLNFANKYGVTVKGQDANGCVLDYRGFGPAGPMITLGFIGGPTGNTLAGFTIRNGWVQMYTGDVLAGCVMVADASYNLPVASGGGLVAQCVFDTPMRTAFQIDPNQFLTSVNSIYFTSQPFLGYPSPAGGTLLLNNDFPGWPGWMDYDGSGNFSEWPLFAWPGPPQEYLPDPGSPTVDRGLPLDIYDPAPPNVGAFQPWWPYTPQPPSGLAAASMPGGPPRVRLTWTASIDDPARMFEYLIYRSESPTFPPATPPNSYASVPAGEFSFEDLNVAPGITYYYQVRGYAGIGPEGTELLSAPTNTASATALNSPPNAVDDTATTRQDKAVTIAVLANDSDPEGDLFHILNVGDPEDGDVWVNPDETIQYIPFPGFAGMDSFSYTVIDNWGGTATAVVTVTVIPNAPPVAMDDAYTTNEDTPLFIPAPGVLGNDTDPDGDPLEALLVTPPAHGTIASYLDGSFVYTPAANYSGTDSFTYFAGDGQLVSAPATVTITVVPVNDPPIALDDTFTGVEDTLLNGIGVLGNDSDPDGDALQAQLVTGTTHGTLTLNPDGSFFYYAAANYNGPDSFTYVARDAQTGSAMATVSINILPANDLPVPNKPPVTTAEDTPVAVTLSATDIDGDVLTYAVISGPAHGSFSGIVPNLIYIPSADFNGSDSFTFRASDAQTGADAIVSITVTPVNDLPVASAQAITTAEDTAAAVTLAATDVDGDVLTFAVASGPAHGTLSGVAPNLTYMPNPDYFGPDSFTFTANDGLAASAPATVSISVTPANDPPQANDDTAATAAYVPVLIAVLGNDNDLDGDTLSVSSATPAANGSTAVQADGSILYTPNPGFTGTDGFLYVVDDGNGGADTAAVTVTVRPQRLRITALTMATVTSGRYTSATATALAVDEAGAPLAGVNIGGSWSGLTSDDDTGITGADGRLTVSSNQVRNANGTFTFTIGAAVKAGYELDGSASELNNSIQYPAPPPPPGGTMHVASITMGTKTGKNGSTSATATVTVVDANGVPVASASVSGSWSDAVSGTSTGTTGADGKVTLSSAGIKNAAGQTFTFTVTGMSNSGWTYDSAANVETSDSITAP